MRERFHDLVDRVLRRSYAPWYAADNGFRSRYHMDRAHAPVVAAAAAALFGRGGNVLDLGCGNGALARKIHEANPDTVPFGIDLNAVAVAHARALLPRYAEHFLVGDLFAAATPWPDDRRYALVLLAPSRFLETSAARAATVRERIARRCDVLVVYAYGTSLTRHGDLAGLCRAAGLRLRDHTRGATAGVAEVDDAIGATARASLAPFHP